MADHSQNFYERLKLAGTLLLLGLAGYLLYGFWQSQGQPLDKAFFYDLSEKKLFVASRTSIPPIPGINNSEADGVRAVVISTNGQAADKTSRRIAYLETYGPELRAQMVAAQATGTSPEMGREAAMAQRLVCRPQELKWHAMNTPEAEQIVNEWLALGPGGGPATLCSP